MTLIGTFYHEYSLIALGGCYEKETIFLIYLRFLGERIDLGELRATCGYPTDITGD